MPRTSQARQVYNLKTYAKTIRSRHAEGIQSQLLLCLPELQKAYRSDDRYGEGEPDTRCSNIPEVLATGRLWMVGRTSFVHGFANAGDSEGIFAVVLRRRTLSSNASLVFPKRTAQHGIL